MYRVMTLFCLNLTSERKALLEQLMNLEDYRSFTKSDIFTAGLSMLLENDKEEKDATEPINFYMKDSEIFKYCEAHKDDKDFDNKMKLWVRTFNQLNTMNET